MARRARVEYPGAVYHVLDRGDRREAIFRDDADRRAFLSVLGEACGRTGWRVHAWVLMSNHYHLLLETPEANLCAGMHWLQTTYTIRFNRKYHLCGHLFQGRYKAINVQPDWGDYFAVLGDYIHLNPVRARLFGPEDRLVNYLWSSYRVYVTGRDRPKWLEVGRVLGESGAEDTVEGRRRYAERMRERAVATLSGEDGEALRRLRRTWCLGEESFRERLLRLINHAAPVPLLMGEISSDHPCCSHDENAAQDIIQAGLAHFDLRPADLGELPKGDPRKLAIARLARDRSAVSIAWLAAALSLGHSSRLSHAGTRAPQVLELARSLTQTLEFKA